MLAQLFRPTFQYQGDVVSLDRQIVADLSLTDKRPFMAALSPFPCRQESVRPHHQQALRDAAVSCSSASPR